MSPRICPVSIVPAPRPLFPDPWPLAPRRGVTLIEMLIAMALTLLLMAGTITVFGVVTSGIAGSRAIIESSERLRAARNRLQTDLAGATVIPVPPRRPESDEGYLEYIEGPMRDGMFDSNAKNNLMGDCDDVLALTVRSRGEPFVGWLPIMENDLSGRTTGRVVNKSTIQSFVAEVVWFILPNGQMILSDTQADPPVQLYTLYRRVRLVLPQAVLPVRPAPPGTTLEINVDELPQLDVSYRIDPTLSKSVRKRIAFNTLGDLTKRENRFGHSSVAPYLMSEPLDDQVDSGNLPRPDGTRQSSEAYLDLNGNGLCDIPANILTGLVAPLPDYTSVGKFIGRAGDDVILTNVVGWDIQAFDPTAPVLLAEGGQSALVPSDPGYALAAMPKNPPPPTILSLGAYVDLNYGAPNGQPDGAYPNPGFPFVSAFSGLPQSKSLLRKNALLPFSMPTYDTWSMHYEQMLSVLGKADAPSGVNGLDDNQPGEPGYGIVDDESEWQTGPPYPVPLRGLQIRIRVYEPDSQQVRSVTVVQDFLAE